MKEQRGRIDHARRVEIGKEGESVIETIPTNALPSKPEPDRLPLEDRQIGSIEPGMVCGGIPFEGRSPRVDEGDRPHDGIEMIDRGIGHGGRFGPNGDRLCPRILRSRGCRDPFEAAAAQIRIGRLRPGGLPGEGGVSVASRSRSEIRLDRSGGGGVQPCSREARHQGDQDRRENADSDRLPARLYLADR